MAERRAPRARLLVQVVLGLLGTAAAGAAEPVEQYLLEYRAYSAAIETGDPDAAIRHARAAWDAAEQELGDHRLTAVLAYNYGRLIAFSDGANANAAFRRCRELLEAGIADLTPHHVSVYADFARFIANGTKRGDARRLRKSLTAVGLDDPELISDLAPMWLRLAADDAVEERFRKAEDSAAMAEAAILKASPESKRALAEAIVIRGIAKLVPYPREVKDVQAAHNEFLRALALFEPQEDIESFDPLFAKVLAWNSAADSALHTLGREGYPDHEGSDDDSLPPAFLRQVDPSINCGKIDWANRDAPNYPATTLRKGYIGAVILGYRIGDDLAVHDARVLAEVPNETFGEAALDAVKRWRVKAPVEGGPECNRDRVVTFKFVIER